MELYFQCSFENACLKGSIIFFSIFNTVSRLGNRFESPSRPENRKQVSIMVLSIRLRSVPPLICRTAIGRSCSCSIRFWKIVKRYKISTRQVENIQWSLQWTRTSAYLRANVYHVVRCLPNRVFRELFRFFRCQPQCQLTANYPIRSRLCFSCRQRLSI